MIRFSVYVVNAAAVGLTTKHTKYAKRHSTVFRLFRGLSLWPLSVLGVLAVHTQINAEFFGGRVSPRAAFRAVRGGKAVPRPAHSAVLAAALQIFSPDLRSIGIGIGIAIGIGVPFVFR